MKLRVIVAASAVLAIGTVAYAFARSIAVPVTKSDASTGCKCCTSAECSAPSACGDADVVCPAGHDCFAPDVCPDREVAFPAVAATTGS